VIVNGSGPVDRDGIFRPAPTLLPPFYKRWADLLAREGIAVLRYDKRFLTHRELDVRRLTQADQVRDVAAAVRHLRERSEVDDARVFILGHSEGASLAPVAAAMDGKVRGVAAVAAVGFSIDSLLLEQLRADPEIAPDTVESIARKFRLLRAGQFPVGDDILGVGPVYWSEWIRYTQQADSVVLALGRPIWVAQGMADEALPGGTLARNVGFWNALASSGKGIEFHTYPGVTHNLFTQADGRTAENVIHDAAKWVGTHR
jgi:acetyl esterase/lipase